jgi:MFS family permease
MFLLGASGNEPKYLLFLLAWLAGAAIAGYLSERKGYGDKPGLVTGLCLSLAGAVVWLIIPPRDNSDWKIKGPIGSARKDR